MPAATRERGLQAAVELLGAEGVRALAHARVDERAGLPTGSTSNWFRTRRALLGGIVDWIAERERAIFNRAVKQVLCGRWASFVGGGVVCDGNARHQPDEQCHNLSVEQRLGTVRLDDGTAIRFAVVGTGPVALYVPGWVSHLELGWAMPAERLFYEGLASGRTLVRYDRPGCGLSGTTDRTDVGELELQVIGAVAGAVGIDAFDLIGASFGAPLAAKFAARNPGSVNRLVLYGGWVQGNAVAAPAVRQHVLGLVEQHWGFASDVLTEIFAPDADAGFRAAFSSYQRESASAATARRLLATCYEIDVSEDLGRIRAQTTVIHRADDRAAPLAEGKRLAEGIAGARLKVLPGRTHVPFVGDVEALVNEIRAGLGLPRLQQMPRPTLTLRQEQVAALVAQGLTNRQIAKELVITERSAESHVERIRLRMGFRSRAQIAAWYAASHPTG